MTRLTIQALAATVAALSRGSATAAPTRGAGALELHACEVASVPGAARCGTLTVWEDRDARRGRTIDLRFVVLPASGPAPIKEAVAFLSGGPGQAATREAAWVATELATVRHDRDLLFLDARGTGGSNPLPCRSARPGDPQSYLKEFYTPADVARCARELRSRADVTQYGSARAMDDLDELRAALGYERLDLYGVSYGTRAALVYLRRHPDRVRAVLMHGSAPTDLRYPLTVPRDAQLALDGVFADCARDPACHGAFPDPAADLAESLRRVEAGPVQAPVLDPATARMTTVALSRDRYTEALRALAYDASTSSLIPAVVHRAARGDFGPAAEEAVAWRMGVEGDSRGVHLAVTCAEDVDFIHLAEASALARGSFMTAWRAQDQKAACAVWPHRKLGRAFLRPVRSGVPLLVMNGEHDPATARYHAERMLQGFPNARLVVIPGAGHGTGGLVGLQACYDGIVARFIRTADAKGLDVGCVSGVHRPPFPTEYPGGEVVPIAPEALARFAGRYAGSTIVEVRVEAGKLHTLAEGEDLTLLPIGPARFRTAVPPHVRVTFREEGGAVAALELANGGAPVETYVRVNDSGAAREGQAPAGPR